MHGHAPHGKHQLGLVQVDHTRVQCFFLGRPVPADQVVAATGRAEHKLARLLRHHGARPDDQRHRDVEDFGATQAGL